MAVIKPIHFNLGDADININLPDSDVAQALVNNQPFPAKEVSVGQASIQVSASKDISLDGGKGKVTFKASGGAYSSIGVYQSGDNLVRALKAADLDDSIAAGLRIPSDALSDLIALRWGYNASGTIKGEVGLGAGGGLNFGADASTEGLFAVIRQLPRNTGAYDAVSQTVNSWKLPRHVRTLNDLEVGTWLIAETNAAIALSLGIQYGYDFSWVREAVSLGGLTGDIGLKVSLGVMASLGFDASGRYALAISRERDKPNVIKFRVFKLNRKGWSFAFNASVGEQFDTGSLTPDNLSDFIKGVFNIQGLQVIKDFERWTSPDNTIADLLGADLVKYAKDFLKKVTGIDPEMAFKDARDLFQSFITKWHDLPHEITSAIYFIFRDQTGEINALKNFLQKVVDDSKPEAIAKVISDQLVRVDFFNTAVGKWLSAAASHGIVSLLNDSTELTKIGELAQKSLGILDGSRIENVLTELQKWIEDKLGLDKVKAAVGKIDDKWLEARLYEFLGKLPVSEELEKVQAAIKSIESKAQDFYDKGIEALKRKYTVEFIATYKKTTTNTALLDVEFDFGANPIDPQVSGYLLDALDGNFNEFMLNQLPGVHLNQGTLTHEIKRNTHIEVNLPFKSVVMDHINTSLGRANAVDTADGRLLMYDLDAKDIVSRRNRRDSQLAVGLHFNEKASIRRFSDDSYSYDYSLRLVERNMKQQFLRYQFKNLVMPYFGSEFEGQGKQSFDTYVSDLDKAADVEHAGTDNLGNALLSLAVSLPDQVMAAWKNAPLGDKDDAYMRMSINLQARLKRIIPFCYFQDAKNYKTKEAAIPLLVYSSIPPSNHVTLTSDGQIHFNDGKGIYWDWEDKDIRAAVLGYGLTVMNLKSRLAGVREVLAATPELRDQLGYYDDNKAAVMIKQVISDSTMATLLHSLLYVESLVVDGARDAGVKFAKFFGEPKPDQALKLLTDFGSDLTDTFNNKIHSIYQGESVRALGTMMFIEAARALSSGLGAIEPTAMLDLIILNKQSQFVPEQFLQEKWPAAKDIFLAQRLVNVGSQGA